MTKLWVVAVLLASLLFTHLAGGDFAALVAENQPQAIRLKSKSTVKDGTVLNLPIRIPEPMLSLDGKMPPRLKSISCFNSSGVYTIGNRLHIYLEYYSEVVVHGIPAIVLNTGCQSGTCVQPEVQSFECRAARGMFSLKIGNRDVMNIDVNTTSDGLSARLRELDEIVNVSVSIEPGDSSPWNRNRVCSEVGNTVTLTFYEVNFPEVQGDIPALELNPFNDNRDSLRHLPQGVENDFLRGAKYGESAFLSLKATEVVKGSNRTHAIVPYSYGNNTRQVTFVYTIGIGDSVDGLDVIRIDFDGGNISSPFGSGLVSQTVPPLGRGYRYMTSSPGSLSSTFSIGITSFLASVVNVTSPTPSGTYTAGDEIIIDVNFNLAVEVSDGAAMILSLATSLFVKEAIYVGQVNGGHSLRFMYDIQPQDSVSVLETTGAAALVLHGASIYVVAGTANVDADVTLPNAFSSTSLSGDKTIAINTNNPIVAYVSVASSDGNYTTGDSIFLDAVFSTAVAVTGTPRIALANSPRQLRASILTAPHLPEFVYRRSFPNGVAAVHFQLLCNVELTDGDEITLYLPRLFIVDEDLSAKRRLATDVHGVGAAANLTGYWNDNDKLLTLFVNGSIGRFVAMDILIEGRSSLFVKDSGLGAPFLETVTFSAKSLPSSFSSSSDVQVVDPVGYQSVELVVTPAVFDQAVQLQLRIRLPEAMTLGDTFTFSLEGFLAANRTGTTTGTIPSNDTSVDYVVDFNASSIQFTVTGSTTGFESTVLRLTLGYEFNMRIPDNGISDSTVLFSMNSLECGVLSEILLSEVTKVCSAPTASGETGVFFATFLPGVQSAARFTFSSGAFGLAKGDSVTFTLSHLSGNGIVGFEVPSAWLYGSLKSSFTASVSGGAIKFTALSDIEADILVDLTVDYSVGLFTPTAGIQSGNSFSFIVDSASCAMVQPRSIPYSDDAHILPAVSGLVRLGDVSALGTVTDIAFSLTLSAMSPGLAAGDVLLVSMPDFSRSIHYIAMNTSVVVSNANVTVLFNRRVQRLQITLNEAFVNGAAALQVNVSRDALLYLPVSGVSSTAHQLSVVSEYGRLSNFQLEGPCVGFCSSSIEFSTVFTMVSLDLRLNFSYSRDLLTGSTIDLILAGIEFESSGSLVVSQGGVLLSASSVVGTQALTISFATATAIASSTSSSFQLSGLLLNASYLQSVAATLQYVDSSLQGTATVDLSCPAVHALPYFESANLTVSVTMLSRVLLSFQLPTGGALSAGDFVDVRLGGFVYSGSGNFSNDFEDNLGLLSETQSFYDASTESVRLVLRSALNSSVVWEVVLMGVQVPVEGLSLNGSDVGYAVGLDASTVAVTDLLSFSDVSEIITISEHDVSISLTQNNSAIVAAIGLQFSLTSALSVGDQVILYMPGLQKTNASLPTSFALNVGGSLSGSSAVWQDDEQRIVVTIARAPDSLLMVVSFNTSGADSYLRVSSEGLPAGSLYTLQVADAQSTLIANATGALPCIGLCSVVVVPVSRNPGRSSAYFINITVGEVLWNRGDQLRLTLPGFSSLTPAVGQNASCSAVGVDGDGVRTVSVQWNQNSSHLSLSYIQQEANVSSAGVRSLYCFIPQSFNLLIPAQGVRADERFVGNLTLFLDSENVTSFSSEAVQVEVVGSPVYSNIEFLPAIANVFVNITVTLLVRDDISAGDTLFVYLPDFAVPTRSIQVFPMNNVSMRLVGWGAQQVAQPNPDDSVYFDRTISHLRVTLLSVVRAGDTLQFSISPRGEVRSPSKGVISQSLPWFSLASDTSPVAGVTFQNITRFGTLSPNSLHLYDYVNRTSVYQYAVVNFTLFCPLLQNDTFDVSLPNIAPINSSYTVELVSFNASSRSQYNVTFNAMWDNSTSLLTIQLSSGYLSSGALSFVLRFVNFERSTAVVYPNDPRVTYSSSSSVCPISTAPFEVSNAWFVDSASVSLVPFAGDGALVYVSWAIKTIVDIHVGDTLTLYLNKVVFDGNCSDECTVSLNSSQRAVLSSALIIPSANDTRIVLQFARFVPALVTVRMNTRSFTNASFHTSEYLVTEDDISYSLTRNSSANGSVLFFGNVQSLSVEPYLLSAAVEIGTPRPSAVSSMSLLFAFSGAVDPSYKIHFFLPEFTTSSYTPASWVYESEDSTQQFSAKWLSSTSQLELVPLLVIPATTEIVVVIQSEIGLKLPAVGIPVSGKVFTLSLTHDQQVIFKGTVSDVTNAAFVQSSQLSFLSCDLAHAFGSGGDTHALQLSPGHELTAGDTGALIDINGTVYVVASVSQDNVLYLEEEYVGPRVFLGSPQISLASPPYRYANYVNGSGFERLRFEYFVERADKSLELALYSLQSDIDLFGGSILRQSMKPILPAYLSIALFQNGAGKRVDTSIPQIVRIFTTTPGVSLSAGQLVDIWIEFDQEVVIVPADALPPPAVIIFVNATGFSSAAYSLGSGSTALLFLYEVQATDFQLVMDNRLFVDDGPVYQPLRIITGYDNVSLFRNSRRPFLDAEVSINQTVQLSFPAEQVLAGATAQVVSITVASVSALGSQVYTAGEEILLEVTFSDEVVVTASNSSLPYIVLSVGAEGVAMFTRKSSATVLEFSYTFQTDDSVPSGLSLACQCEDFLQRTFIRGNSSSILTASTGIAAASLLAKGSSQGDLVLHSDVVLDNDPPTVATVRTNVSSNVFAQGSAIAVSVTYSDPVMILGLVSLRLVGRASYCRAGYFAGNGTSTLTFLYYVSWESGAARLECTDADALDVSLGAVYKLSAVAAVLADNTLPTPGSPASMGRLQAIVIDPSRAKVAAVELLQRTDNKPVLSAVQLPFNKPQRSFEELLRLCHCEATESNLLESSHLTALLADWNIRYSISNYTFEERYHGYERIELQSNFLRGIADIPSSVQTCFNWWKGYFVTDKVLLGVRFDRPVTVEGGLLQLSTHEEYLRTATSIAGSTQYSLEIRQPSRPSREEAFAFRSAGLVSACLADTASSGDILDALRGLPNVAMLDPAVSQPARASGTLVFELRFSYPVELEVLQGDEVRHICALDSDSIVPSVQLARDHALVVFEQDVLAGDSLVLRANATLPAGTYSFNFSGPQLSVQDAVDANSFVLRELTEYETVVGESTVSNNVIGRITWSSLHFTSVTPGESANMRVELCSAVPFAVNDRVSVHLPLFNATNSALSLPTSSFYTASWSSANSSVVFTVTSSTSCLGEVNTATDLPVTLRTQAIYRNDPSFTFSVWSSTAGELSGRPFDTVSPVGVASASIALNDSRPFQPTELVVEFESMLDLNPGNDSITVSLPTFYAADIKHADIFIDGPLSGLIDARWSNQTSSLHLSPAAFIPAGQYRFVVQSRKFPITIGPEGVSLSNPPTLRIDDADWTMDDSALQAFPLIVGYSNASLEMDVNSSYSVRGIRFYVEFTHAVTGPAMLSLRCPSLQHIDNYFFVSAVDDSAFTYDNATWFGHNQTWVLWSQQGWMAREPLVMEFINISDFRLSKDGLRAGYTSDIQFSVQSSDGAQVAMSPVLVYGSIPVISASKFVVEKLERNAFHMSGHDNLVLTFDVNTFPQLQDRFQFEFAGAQMNFSRATVSDSCYYIAEWGTSDASNRTSLAIALSNSTASCFYRRVRHVKLNISGVAVDPSSRRVQQFGVPYAWLSWSTPSFASDYFPFVESSWIGVYSSSARFNRPFAGQDSDLLLKMLVSTQLNASDRLLVTLGGMQANWTSKRVSDQYGRAWPVTFTSNSSTLTLSSPCFLYPSGLQFLFSGDLQIIVPADGVASNLSTSSPNIIALQAAGRLLTGQAIHDVSPVGKVQDGMVTLTRSLHSSSGDQAAFTLSTRLLNPLLPGDVVHVDFRNLLLQYPAVLPVIETDGDLYTIVTTSRRGVNITMLTADNSVLRAFSIDQTAMVNVDGSRLCEDSSQCDAIVSIYSDSNPVREYALRTRGQFVSVESTHLVFSYRDRFDRAENQSFNASIVTAFNASDNVVGCTFNFSLLSEFSTSSVISLDMSSVFNASDIGSAALEVSGNNATMDVWRVLFFNDSLLTLQPLRNVSAGNYSLDLKSEAFSFVSEILFASSFSVRYTVFDGETVSDNNYVRDVSPWGLRSAEVQWLTAVAGELSALEVTITAVDMFRSGDVLTLTLPGVEKRSSSALTGVLSFDGNATWIDETQSIEINVHQGRYTSLSLQLPESNELVLPLSGAAATVNVPSISYNVSARGLVFGSTPLTSFTTFSPNLRANISFSPATAFAWSTVSIELESNSFALSAGDQFRFHFPQCSSFEARLNVTASAGNWRADWSQCQEIVSLTLVNESLVVSELLFEVSSLRLPPRGVDVSVISGMSADVASAEYDDVDVNLASVPVVGYLSDSRLEWSAGAVDAANEMLLGFALSLPLGPGDTVTLQMPGVNITNACTFSVVPSTLFTLNASAEALSLIAVESADAFAQISLNSSSCVFLPSSGFPPTGLAPEDYTISAITSAGVVGATPIAQLASVGLLFGAVHYTVVNAELAVSLRLELEFSHTLVIGDQVSVSLPALNYTLFDTDKSVDLQLRGDLRELDFESPFTGVFDLESNSIELVYTSVDGLPPRRFNVFATVENVLGIGANVSAPHFAAANLSAVGQLEQRELMVSPQSLSVVRDPTLAITACDASRACQYALSFELVEDLAAGAGLVLTSPCWTLTQNRSLALQDGAAQLSPHWRSADNQDRVSVPQQQWSTAPQVGFDVTWADSDVLGIDKQIEDTTVIEGLSFATTVIPSVLNVFPVNWTHTRLYPLEDMRIGVQFTTAVTVFSLLNSRPKLMMNTGELAMYSSGSGTDTLVFRYTPRSPSNVGSLGVAGPAALELLSSGLISLSARPDVAANLTIAEPFDLFVSVNGYRETVEVSDPSDPVIERVFTYSRNVSYSSGDILDVAVKFVRPVNVSGDPRLRLSHLDGLSEQEIVLSFVNVSRVQYLNVEQDGEVAFILGSDMSACVHTSDTAAIRTAISSLRGLAWSLPLSVHRIVDDDMLRRYQLVFGDIAPAILGVESVHCSIRASTHVTIDIELMNVALFRAEVKARHDSGNWSYVNQSSLSLTTGDSFRMNSPAFGRPLNLTLPSASPSLVDVDNTPPFIARVASTFFSDNGRSAVNGDTVVVDLELSAPVVVRGSVTLEIAVQNYLQPAVQSRNLTLHSWTPSVLSFHYVVEQGDYADPLGVLQVHLEHNATVLRQSRIPAIGVNWTLPTNASGNSLTSSRVSVNATELPVILKAYNLDAAYVATAGTVVTIGVLFSSPVSLRHVNSTLYPQPYVVTETPPDGHLLYVSGAGSNLWTFQYTVQPLDSSGNMSFYFHLIGGRCVDLFGREFQNRTESLIVVDGLTLNTDAPYTIRVDCNCDNGTYFPGDVLDLFVYFSDAVLLIPLSKAASRVPQLEMFVPTQFGPNILATYKHGNGTHELHFEYVVPAPNPNALTHLPFKLDYAGVSALRSNLRDFRITSVSPNPQTEVDVQLPILDQSHLIVHRVIYISLTEPRVESVSARSGVFTAGDRVLIAVNFTQPVMVTVPPPVLLLRIDSGAVAATFSSGNGSSTLWFEYKVRKGDKADVLEYVDTTAEPYDSDDVESSCPMASHDDFESGIVGRPLADVYSASPSVRFAVPTQFPRPTAAGSLSATSLVRIDTTPPTIRRVTTVEPSGTYGSGMQIHVQVVFSWPVVTTSCPRLLFVVDSTVRYAPYLSGNGSDTLVFTFTILPQDYTVGFDYYGTVSFELASCSVVGGAGDVLRVAEVPTILANLTMPMVNYRPNVLSPVSILMSGRNITLGGLSYVPIDISTTLSRYTALSFGDVVDFNLTWSEAVLPRTSLIWVEMTSASDALAIYTLALFSNQSAGATLLFSMIPGPYDEKSDLSFASKLAFRSSITCPVVDARFGRCVAHNLPEPRVDGTSQGDRISPLRLSTQSLSIHRTRMVALGFVLPAGKSHFSFGDRVVMRAQFTGPVVVVGQPALQLTVNHSYVVEAGFWRQDAADSIMFSFVASSDFAFGSLQCGRRCEVDVNRGSVLRATNFLPIVRADLAIPEKTCRDEQCVQSETRVVDEVPYVVRVLSNASDVRTLNDSVFIFVEFSAPIRVRGHPRLQLHLAGYPYATLVGTGTLFNNSLLSKEQASHVVDTVLLFHYRVRAEDATSALDYAGVDALSVAEDADALLEPAQTLFGVFADCELAVPVDRTLPTLGTPQSLGVSSVVVIDQNRPVIVSVTSKPSPSTTCGDMLVVSIAYNIPMLLVPPERPAVSPNGTNSSAPAVDMTLRLALRSSPTAEAPLREFDASFESLEGATLRFSVFVSSFFPLSYVTLGSNTPLHLGSFKLVSQFTNVPSPVVFSDDVVSAFAVQVVRTLPAVLRVSSPNISTEYSFGVGDVIFVDVLFSAAVRVEDMNATMVLSLNGAVREAQFLEVRRNDTIVRFSYEVGGDDRTSLLTYMSRFALKGRIFQISQCNTPVPADLTLPPIGAPESLSGCCPISIDSTPPYVDALFPVKAQGTYGANELVLVIARFSSPVVVQGIPRLRLKVSDNSSAEAVYVPPEDVVELCPDLTVSILETDVAFMYQVQANDSVANIVHSGVDALQVDSTARILQSSDSPSYDADTSLREPEDFTTEVGGIIRQWKYRFFQSIDIILRDLSHPDASALTATVSHLGSAGVLFSGCCNGDNSNAKQREFGYSKNYYAAGSVSTGVLAVESDQGEDVIFSDSSAPNLAVSDGSASQSSTLRAAALAIDGGYSAVVGDGSVTETVQESDPWWQVSFRDSATVVQTIVVYERLPQTWIQPVVQFTIKGLDRMPSGYFRLQLSNFNPANASEFIVTPFIKIGATDTGVLRALAPYSILGNVRVDKRVLPLCVIEGDPLSYGLGCGDGTDFGFGAVYKLTFLDLLVAEPVVEIVDIRYPGQPLNTNGTQLDSAEAEYLAQNYPLSIRIERLRKGSFEPVFKQYQGDAVGIDTSFANAWLTPFYVYIFPPSVSPSNISSNITIAQQQAVWYARFTSINKARIITLPKSYAASAIRIQREGEGQLSLTEVAVYSTPWSDLSAYKRGSPVQAPELGSLHNSATPLRALYSQMPYDGLWVVTLSQQAAGTSALQGSVSEAVIVVTDRAGVVSAYYQDIFAVVESLPRYGTLFMTQEGSLMSYTSWFDAFGLLYRSPIESDAARSRHLAPCVGDPQGLCFMSQQVPGVRDYRPELTRQVVGDRPLTKTILRAERVVYYVPDPGFRGQDNFLYSTFSGFAVQQAFQQVSLVVQPCRLFLNRSAPLTVKPELYAPSTTPSVSRGDYWHQVSAGLCSCAPSATHIVSDEAACEDSRAALCSDSSLRGHFMDMCLACYGNSLLGERLGVNLQSNDADKCRGWTIRAASLLLLRGLCARDPALTAAQAAAMQHNTNNTDYDSYFKANGVGVGMQAILPQECLVPDDPISVNFIMRARDMTTQSKGL